MENRFEILDKLLNDSLLHNTIIILGFLTDHDWCLGLCPKGRYEASLQRSPYLVGKEEYCCLDGIHEGDPLVVRSVRSIISTLHTIQVHYAIQVRLQVEEVLHFVQVVRLPGTQGGCRSCHGSSSSLGQGLN